MNIRLILLLGTLGASSLAYSAVSPEEAARLGKDLTPWGAEMAGNKEGTIPPYTGGLPTNLMGPNFDSNKSIVKGRQSQPDPFKDEKPLYKITAQNYTQYADKLSETVKQLFKDHPEFYMNVYPTHRVANYPKNYIDSSLKNATRCSLGQGGEGTSGCKGGMPFPIPKNGMEVITNLTLGIYIGPGLDQEVTGAYVDRNGNIVETANTLAYFHYPFQDPNISLEDYENTAKPYGRLTYRLTALRLGPARIAGEGQMLTIPSDARQATSFSYQPGNRRVRATPNVEYDYPLASAGGAGFYDESYIWSGRKDRFEPKLIGKKEMIIPYSNYRLAYSDMKDSMKPGYPNPALTRWELHRTWVVELTRKPGARHAFAKRVLHIDEDIPVSAIADDYDDSGKVVRGNFGSALWIWDYQLTNPYFWNVDVKSGAYACTQHHGNGNGIGSRFRRPDGKGGSFNADGRMLPDSEFTPDALARRSQR